MKNRERKRAPYMSPEAHQTLVANHAIETAEKLNVSAHDSVVATRPTQEILEETKTHLASMYGRGKNPINTFSEVIERHTLPLEVTILFNGKTGLVLGINPLPELSLQKSAEEKLAKGEKLSPEETAFVLGKIALKD
jgi:hypothetical protein